MKTHPSTERGSLAASVHAALHGLFQALRRERNLKIHVAAATLAVVLAVWLKFSALEVSVVLLAIGLVIVAELLNSAVESTVGLCVGARISEEARVAKDVSAGAVLFGALMAAAIGGILYIPALWQRLK